MSRMNLDINKVKCYVGVCYRTPTVEIYGDPNHILLQDIIKELGSTKNISCLWAIATTDSQAGLLMQMTATLLEKL